MNWDKFGRCYVSGSELSDLLYQNPNLDLSKFLINDYLELDKYRFGNYQLYAELPEPNVFLEFTSSIEDFDKENQNNWHMPETYKQLDIAQWLLNQCKEDFELQRVGHELLMYQERNLFDLLRYLKYLVDTLRKNNIVWGVGRGSSVASYVLYLIGVHKINSIYYDLSIEDFLR